ncbi:hypothetical protein L7F22_064958 [Adiantum nelumboides]|nr:hypothetical protein [Adiantum nelumboides]
MSYYYEHFLSISEQGFIETPEYMQIYMPHHLRVVIGQLRVSSHQLAIERGRAQGIPREERICQICQTEVESEEHMVIRCPAYSELRSRYTLCPTLRQCLTEMDQRQFGRFLAEALRIREERLHQSSTAREASQTTITQFFSAATTPTSQTAATMTKIIKEMLPRHVRVARDAQDLLVECCVEFINLISSESNEICSREDKRTIAPEHVMKALEVLGFGDYLEEVHLALEEHRREALDSPKGGGKWGKDGMGMTEEEAVAEQQRMFAEARERMLSGGLPTPKQEGDQA